MEQFSNSLQDRWDREWRTGSIWGLAFAQRVVGGTPPVLALLTAMPGCWGLMWPEQVPESSFLIQPPDNRSAPLLSIPAFEVSLADLPQGSVVV
jgi:hypothetical protein